jgi:excinuclease UvrABC helicase subunit UvrB
VESQCREKADYSSRHPLACFDEAVVVSQMSFACDIETPSNFLELASTLKTKKILAGNVVLRKVSGAQYSRMLYKRHHLVFGRVGHLHILGRYE